MVQALELLNGEEFYQIIYSGKVLEQAAANKEFSKAIDQLYWSALNRPASIQEMQSTERVFKNMVQEAQPKVAEAAEQVWIDDELPADASTTGTGGAAEAWKWKSKAEAPVFSGNRAHTQGGKGDTRQHYTMGWKKSLSVGPADVFFTYVYLDPKNLPKEIMLQWDQNGWEHRAFSGTDLIPFGTVNSRADITWDHCQRQASGCGCKFQHRQWDSIPALR